MTHIDEECYRFEQIVWPWEKEVFVEMPEARRLVKRVCEMFGVEHPTHIIRMHSWTIEGRYSRSRNRIQLRVGRNTGRCRAETAIHETCHHVAYELHVQDDHGPCFRALLQVANNWYAREHRLTTGAMPKANDDLLTRFSEKAGYYECPTCGWIVPIDRRERHNSLWGCE